MNLVWFRNDLRLADHPALAHALKNGNKTIALYVLHTKQHQIHGESPNKLNFIKSHVKDLRKRLKNIGITLLVQEVPLYKDITNVFRRVLNAYSIQSVFMNNSYWVNEVDRDRKVLKLLKIENIKVNQFHANYLLPPGSVRKSDGSMYHVFTPFKKKYVEHIKSSYQLPLPIPKKTIDSIEVNQPLDDIGILKQCDLPKHMQNIWPIGEVAANEKLKQFVFDNDYSNERDFPAIKGTSSLSPYLAIGVVSAQQCLAYMLKQIGEEAFYSTWVSELIWRDFYNDLMFEYPRLAKHKTFKPDAVDHWHENDDLFKKWQQGQTGFPIVDAGMRQLLKEGWMHNRVRMIVASFLTKLCLIDWRKGEAHFMAHLLDGDLASNNGGWQWSSATGCDAAPYFRIFNPTAQSKKFDPDGTYIRKYVPELEEMNAQSIHEPDSASRNQCGYVEPVINYKLARADALAWFKK